MGDTKVSVTPPAGDQTDDQRTDDQTDAGQSTDTSQAGDDVDDGDEKVVDDSDDTDDDGDDKVADDTGDDADDTDNTDDTDDADDSDDGEVDPDDDRLDGKVRRQLTAKNRENKRLRERAKKAEHALLQIDVARKTGLPIDLASRLVGATEDELVNDAGSLMEQFGVKARVTPDNLPNDGTTVDRAPGTSPDDLDAVAERIYRRNN